MLIANPIYDSVFKYLMQDKKSALIMISAILEMNVIDLEFNAQEFNLETDYFSVYRVDFKATVKKKNGEQLLVLIEIQKIKFSTEDIFRFRTYLGQQYLSKSNVNANQKPLPIITIYILGHYLEDYHNTPILRIKKQIIEHGSNKELEGGKSDFIELLNHDSVIIQIPALKKKKNKKNELEKLLDIFELVKKRQTEFNEKNLSKTYFPILRRLHKAVQNEELQAIMTVEDEIIDSIRQKEGELLAKEEIIKQEKQRTEQEKQRAEQEKQRAEQEKQRAEQEKQRAEQEKQRAEQLEQEKIDMIKKMLDKGIPIELVMEIAKVNRAFLKKHNLIS
jgi:hypothetical protein